MPTWFPPSCYLVDVSGWQDYREADWNAACDDGCVGAYVKRSQGCGPSKSGRLHAQRIEPSPVFRGDYHFADRRRATDRLNPKRQADVFVREVGKLRSYNLRPALDVEWPSFKLGSTKKAYYNAFPPSANTDWILTWLDHVEAALGVTPIIYTLASYARYRLKPVPELARYDLWLAGAGGTVHVDDPTTMVPGPEQVAIGVPEPWDDWTLYQWTSRGSVPWYRDGKGNIDRNVPRNWLATLRSLRAGGAS